MIMKLEFEYDGVTLMYEVVDNEIVSVEGLNGHCYTDNVEIYIAAEDDFYSASYDILSSTFGFKESLDVLDSLNIKGE